MTTGVARHLQDVIVNVEGVDHHIAVPPVTEGPLASGALYDATAIERVLAAGGHVHRVDMRRIPYHPINLRAVLSLRRLVRDLDATVVHGHSSIGGALARLAAAGTGVPAFYTPNGLAAGRPAHSTERALGPLTSRLIAVSDSEAAEVRRLGVARADQIVIIPNGIDVSPPGPASTDLRAALGLAPSVPLVGSIARLVPQKAPEELVAVCAAVARQRPEPHFLLIGLGPLQDRLDQAVAASGLGGRWHQIPHLPDAAATLGQLDVFVLPSRFEGGPYTPLEAMRAGTPVVLSDVVGNHDTVEDAKSGFLVPFGDHETMAGRVVALLGDSDLRSAMAAAAQARLRTQFDVATMGARLGELYGDVAGGPNRRRTRRLPHPRSPSSVHAPEASAARYNS